jgi:polyisoprenyl-phosphate glycosyltransferase
MRKLSVVVAAYNEEGNLPLLFARLRARLGRRLGLEPEFVFVDDHSRDRTPQVLAGLAAADPRVKVLRFSRNFGSHKAFTAGLEHCTGDAAVILAADLQDPPETIPLLVEKWRAGAQVVWASARPRGRVARRPGSSRGTYYPSCAASPRCPPRAGRRLPPRRPPRDRRAAAAPEKHTSLIAHPVDGLRAGRTSPTKAARHSGRSNWTLRKKLKLAVDSFVSFSYAPVRLDVACGLLFAFSGFLYAAVIAIRALSSAAPSRAGRRSCASS